MKCLFPEAESSKTKGSLLCNPLVDVDTSVSSAQAPSVAHLFLATVCTDASREEVGAATAADR